MFLNVASSPCANILIIIYADIVAGQIKVFQTPGKTQRLAGENVTFYCAFPLFQDTANVIIYWWKLGEAEFLQPGSDIRKRFLLLKKGEASLQLLDVKAADSGVYYCGVKHLVTRFTNGTGSKLIIYVPPIPLSIKSELSVNNVSGTLTILCKTAAFYPGSINVTWYKDNISIETGIQSSKALNSNGLYELSSYLEVTGAVTSVTCQVTHRTLMIPVNATFTVPNWKVRRFQVSLTHRFILAFLVILILTTIIVEHLKWHPFKDLVQKEKCN
ncbi:natural cytotoxicity triggering receptor 3 ligand 1-like [Carcharodon carcharias]|uniref:natural cytotoxicity triggering receptor 3 ligand 1-like n=1 Tax=Carcharodon carcharias TaxID=13397 RepID=UPI001B7DCDA3|nr:natural cytotoxicity triggering receptor 3 ligand 1-like [Carcharodon carcharias]